MTIKEAIAQIDELCPNQYTRSQKLHWLSDIDRMVAADVLSKYEYENASAGKWYDESELPDDSIQLIVPSPYDEMYLYYLQAQIDYWNRETAKYNNSIIRFNESFALFAKYWRNTHTSKLQSFKYI